MNTPVITIDGPSGSGKGTVSRLLAQRLGWHFLDSGALYRVVALAASQKGTTLDDEAALCQLIKDIDIQFEDDPSNKLAHIYLSTVDVTLAIRSESCSAGASKVAVLSKVRQALLSKQRDFHQLPGLVADGRDMGTVVFPAAELKIFLIASQQERAKRRYKQLKDKEMDVNLNAVLDDIKARDQRDSGREISPMVPASDAVTVDTTALSIDDVVDDIHRRWQVLQKGFNDSME